MKNNETGLRDNHIRGTVADFLREKIDDGSKVSIVSAYFTIYAYEALKSDLDSIDSLDFLFGDPTFINRMDPDKTEKKAFIINSEGLELSNKLQQRRIARECSEWIRKKVSIKTIKQANLLHGKMYHINSAKEDKAIIGSSNFTVKGLGLGKNGNNIELNLVVDSDRDRKELMEWFNAIWNNENMVKDVKADVLNYLEKLYVNHTPEFIYFKTLFHIFEKYLEENGKTDLDIGKTTLFETKTWKKLFEFQKDGAKGVINKLRKHNGCIIADSVGLGKTFIALASIKYFELKNERVLVLCPKKLRTNWTVYKLNSDRNDFLDDRYRYDVLSHTDLSRSNGLSGEIDLSTINWGNYDLVVIDESHNFRNNTPGRKDSDGNLITRSRYKRLMDDIVKSGIKTKVLLISATPVNNNLKDLRNQISFLTEDKDNAFESTIGIKSLKDTLASAQRTFSAWAKQNSNERKTSELVKKLDTSFFKLLDELTIARSRKHILKYYADSIEKLGGFPKREKPVTICAKIDIEDRFPSYDKLNQDITGYKLSIFNPSSFVKEEHKEQYSKTQIKEFTQEGREDTLIQMMKVNFLKRLESSVKSFEITMERTIIKIEEIEKKIKAYKDQSNTNHTTSEFEVSFDNPDNDEEIEAALEVGGKLKYKLEHLKLDGPDGWLNALKKDKDQILALLNAARSVTVARDAKLKELKALIYNKVKNPTTNKLGKPNKKVIVFTAFADTASYIYDSIKDWAKNDLGIHTARVGGGGDTETTLGGSSFEDILINFSPVSKGRATIPNMPTGEEIDVLIATDCISEGQNLQDCDYLVNYDIHWNPVRIIQRFGRIDRIGSINNTVHLVNFWPTDDLNNYIKLKNRVESRMALVDLSATSEDNLLDNNELEEIITQDLRYRDKQLLSLKDEVLDIEDLGDGLSLTDMTLDDFRFDLLKYLEANKESLEEAPFGLYTCVPTNAEYQIIQPGAIFCFSVVEKNVDTKTNETSSNVSINPLNPYFLVYVLEDGNVRYSFANPKQILDIYRILCAGKSEIYTHLCDIFDKETKNGTDMKPYDSLIVKAMKSIETTFKNRAASGLQSGRDFVIPNVKEHINETTELELITWLVIKSP